MLFDDAASDLKHAFGTYELDFQGTILYAQPLAEIDAHNFDSEKVGHNFADLVPFETIPELRLRFREFLQQESVPATFTLNCRFRGQPVTLDLIMIRVYAEGLNSLNASQHTKVIVARFKPAD